MGKLIEAEYEDNVFYLSVAHSRLTVALRVRDRKECRACFVHDNDVDEGGTMLHIGPLALIHLYEC